MNCHEIRDRLPLHLYGDLDAAERAAVEAHLGECPACRSELAALAAVRVGLDDTPVSARPVDLPRLFQAEADRLGRRARHWRCAAYVAALAAVLLLAVRLEVRVSERQLSVRWGAPEQPPPVTVRETIVIRSEPAPDSGVEERLATMSEIVQALAASVESSDRDRSEQLATLRRELATFHNQSQKRWSETERDVSALYTAQFKSRPSGVNP